MQQQWVINAQKGMIIADVIGLVETIGRLTELTGDIRDELGRLLFLLLEHKAVKAPEGIERAGEELFAKLADYAKRAEKLLSDLFELDAENDEETTIGSWILEKTKIKGVA